MGKIRRIRLIAASIPLQREFLTARALQRSAESIFVIMEAEDGYYGIGEATPKGHVTGEKLESAFLLMRDLISRVYLGRNTEDAVDLMERSNRELAFNPAAKSSFDTACYDINSKQAGKPLYKYLGGTKRNDLFLNGHLDLNVKDLSASLQSEGMRRFNHCLKLKLGRKPPEDSWIIRQVREEVGDGVKIVGDANQGWTLEDAIEFVSVVDRNTVECLEQPLLYNDITGMRKLQASTEIPIMADESLWSVDDARYLIELEAARMINIKLMKSGGISGALRIIRYADQKGTGCMIGSTVETSLSTSVEMALSSVSHSIRFVDSILAGEELVDDPVETDVKITGDAFTLSEKPGTGCRLIPEVLSKYKVHEAEVRL